MRFGDWVLLISCGLLALAAPVMAFQEYAAHEADVATRQLTGQTPDRDVSFRAAWRLPLTALVFLLGVAGTLLCVRVLAHRVVRALSKRLFVLLLAGMTLVDVSYALDGTLFLDAPYLVRATTVVWGYAVGAFLAAGAAYRLADVRDRFAR